MRMSFNESICINGVVSIMKPTLNKLILSGLELQYIHLFDCSNGFDIGSSVRVCIVSNCF